LEFDSTYEKAKRNMNILEKIVETKRAEVAQRKAELPAEELKSYHGFNRKCNPMKAALLKPGATGIIAEFKKKSPSKGMIHPAARVEEVTREYVKAGATGLSVLTDHKYFGGTLNDLVVARKANPSIPILRKDFIIDTYQVLEAKAFGADVILLIAACLEKSEVEILAGKAKALGMEVLMEVHNKKELEKMNDFIDMIGVNNRNLETMKVDVTTSGKLAGYIPEDIIKISESGLKDAETIRGLKQKGYKGFLIGETFMQTRNPGEAFRKLLVTLDN
jgi:indole-3-glycerol phosphate synthase